MYYHLTPSITMQFEVNLKPSFSYNNIPHLYRSGQARSADG